MHQTFDGTERIAPPWEQYREIPPPVIEAFQWNGESVEGFTRFMDTSTNPYTPYLMLGRGSIAKVGDYILKDARGSVWKHDAEFFERNYKKAT